MRWSNLMSSTSPSVFLIPPTTGNPSTMFLSFRATSKSRWSLTHGRLSRTHSTSSTTNSSCTTRQSITMHLLKRTMKMKMMKIIDRLRESWICYIFDSFKLYKNCYNGRFLYSSSLGVLLARSVTDLSYLISLIYFLFFLTKLHRAFTFTLATQFVSHQRINCLPLNFEKIFPDSMKKPSFIR